jgi:hypothetical protein
MKTTEEVKASVKTIPMWKWILLHFCPAYVSYDTEGDIACVIYAKVLFKKIYIMRTDYFCISTGNLLRSGRLTRRQNNE